MKNVRCHHIYVKKRHPKHAYKNVRCYNIYVKKRRLKYEKTSPKYHSQLLTVQEDCFYPTVKTYFTTTVFDFLFAHVVCFFSAAKFFLYCLLLSFLLTHVHSPFYETFFPQGFFNFNYEL